ncbi:hypothetical protein B0H13DRAFT_1893929 [Mycena leptocephala]|nr:hypothetical protein B0H13DRAFT_1893929 [Mycena leptocephala]
MTNQSQISNLRLLHNQKICISTSKNDAGRDGEDDDREMPPADTLLSSAISAPANRNAATVVKTFAKKQKLCGEQITQLEAFLNVCQVHTPFFSAYAQQDVQTVREGKLFCLLLALQTDIGAIITAAPLFAVSAELKKNIEAFIVAVMLSPKLGMYKGDVPVQHVMDIILKHRFDLPPGIENNPANMGKLKSVVQYYCTQHHSSCKKQLFASVRVARLNENGEKMTVYLPPDQHQNLFALAQSFVDGTKCRITNALCGRIALMSVYLESSGQTFWSDLDKALGLMREAGKGSNEARDAMVEVLIETDKELHGTVEIVYQNNDNIQQEVDDLIHASATNAASTPANPASSIAPQGGPEPDEQEE